MASLCSEAWRKRKAEVAIRLVFRAVFLFSSAIRGLSEPLSSVAVPARRLNILFICTANVCRSPLAAGLLAYNAKQAGLEVNIASASLDHEIRPTHATTTKLLAGRDITLVREQSQPLSDHLIDGADLVLVMTTEHAKGVVGRFPGSRRKVFLLSHLTGELNAPEGIRTTADWLQMIYARPRDYANNTKWDIPDPNNQPDSVYQAVDTLIDNATAWLATVLAILPSD